MAEEQKPLVFVVNGYGCHLDSPLGNVYLPRVVRYILEDKPNLVIFCGGFTQRKSAGNISEAQVMRDFVVKEIAGRFEPEKGYIIDVRSYTTLENSLYSSFSILLYYGGTMVRIKHFCEATRSANVVMLDRHFTTGLVESIDDIMVETASWERADPFKQAGNLVYNKLALKLPYLAKREHNRRVARSFYI